VDADLSPGHGAASIEAAGLVDDSTGEGTYYTDATGASAAQATYVEVGGRPAEAAGMYAELARPYVKEVKRSR
jgi:flavin-dependent dehydrogenase